MRILIFYTLFCCQIFALSDTVHADAAHFKPFLIQNGPSIDSLKFLRNFYQGEHALINGIASSLSVPNNLSPSCVRDVERFVKQISPWLDLPHQANIDEESNIEDWALTMLDSWAKLPDGVLSGHVNALGDYDECLSVRAKKEFQGKYCLLYLMPNFTQLESVLRVKAGERSMENLMEILSITVQGEMPVIPTYGSCLPSTCSDNDIFEIVSKILSQVNLTPVAAFCSMDEPLKLSRGAIVTISILGMLVFFVVIATLRNVYNRHYTGQLQSSTLKTLRVLDAFSLAKNLGKLFKTETSKNDIGCLYGLRFLGASWVVLCHTYMCATRLQPVYNFVDAYSFLTRNSFSSFVANGAIVVDIFLVIGGFLVSLTLFSTLERSNGKLNLAMLYIHRYLRITPLYGIIILMGTFIFPLLGSGPYWHVAKVWAGFCERNWWKNLLYINNLPIYDTLNDPSDGPCHGLAWYLGVDMQLFLLSPFLLYPIWKWKINGSAPLVVTTLISVILPGLITYLENYLPTPVPFASAQNRYSQLAYTPTYMRATPYFIGICTGIWFHSSKNTKLKKPNVFVPAAWLMSFAVLISVIFGPQKFLDSQYQYSTTESGIYVSGHRTAWALAISWIIFACGSGYGGWINRFLCWKPFVPLGRLTFAIYLVSLHLQFLFHLQYRQSIYFGNYLMVNLFFSHLVMSTFVAFLCMVLIEAPAMNLLKLLFPGRGSSRMDSGSKRCKTISESVLIGGSNGSLENLPPTYRSEE